MEMLFSGRCDPARPTALGPGYTGYSMGASPTLQVGAIVVDRRTNDLYVGFSAQSRLPGGLRDFEPAGLAMTPSGRMKWWSRLYTESTMNSTPDPFVDRLDVDPSTGEFVVLARCHGNNTRNFWAGNAVAARPSASAFHNPFTGTNGNIHVSWLGRFDAADGTLRASSFLGEYTDGVRGAGAAYTDPLLDGWPSHNTGWPDLNTTRAEALAVDPSGHVTVIATGRRTITTRNAFMRMPQPAAGASGWNDFVRGYLPDRSSVRYSTLLRGPWDPAMDGGDGNVKLMAVVPLANGSLAVGYHVARGGRRAGRRDAHGARPRVRGRGARGADPLEGRCAASARIAHPHRHMRAVRARPLRNSWVPGPEDADVCHWNNCTDLPGTSRTIPLEALLDGAQREVLPEARAAVPMGRFRYGRARDKALAIQLALRGPRVPGIDEGDAVEEATSLLAELGEATLHELLPARRPDGKKLDAALLHDAGNIVLVRERHLPRLHACLLGESGTLFEKAAPCDEALRRSHAIPPEALEALRAGDGEAFVRLRGEFLRVEERALVEGLGLTYGSGGDDRG